MGGRWAGGVVVSVDGLGGMGFVGFEVEDGGKGDYMEEEMVG